MPDISEYPNDFAAFNRALIAEFRANGGKTTGMFADAPLVLLTTKGAKSGQPRTTPVVYTTNDNGEVVVIASKAGAPTHPDWYHNLVANPEVTVELANETYTARARQTEEPERTNLYAAQAALMPNFDEYAKLTDRKIPVFVLERS
ncbi:MAG: nitroreductase family deazaflavin-dependent oxidoreductase [Acidimicrobiia bacterium]